MRSDKEIMRQADRDITKLTNQEYDKYLVIKQERDDKLAKLPKKQGGAVMKKRGGTFKGTF